MLYCQTITHLKIDNFTVENVENFNYLGSSLNADNKMNLEIEERKKRIPPIFKDESTGSCICLRSLIYMLYVLLLCKSFLRVSVVLY
jgi:hypothetical protein